MAEPSGRVRHIDAGMMQMPACCAICGSVGSEDGYADPQIYIEYHGNIYFCENCAVELSMFWGSIPQDVGDRLKLALREREEEVLRLNAIISTWEPLIEQLRVLANDSSDALASAIGSVDLIHVHPVQESEQGTNQLTFSDAESEGTDDSGVAEPVKDDGPDQSSELDSGDELIESVLNAD